jgi:hypothetical protein
MQPDKMGRVYLRYFLAGLLMLSLLFVLGRDLRDLRLTVSQKRMGSPIVQEAYGIYMRLAEVQGFLDQGDKVRARSRLEGIEKEAAAYRGNHPEFLWFELGLLWTASGDSGGALRCLEASLSQGNKASLKAFFQHPALEPLKANPSFQALQRL